MEIIYVYIVYNNRRYWKLYNEYFKIHFLGLKYKL